MSTRARWSKVWLASARAAKHRLWRAVEAQHKVATLRLVDTLAEQALLEEILEASKPPLPRDAQGLHFLIFTPFRYSSPVPSRFRRANEPGLWYGADERHTVCAELAWWRWRFLMDSEGLRDGELITEHTFFCAEFSGQALNLMAPPWLALRDQWRHPHDHSACQALAHAVRESDPGIDAVRYESARHEGGACMAVFTPKALAIRHPGQQQTWVCKTTKALVLVSHDKEGTSFVTKGWK